MTRKRDYQIEISTMMAHIENNGLLPAMQLPSLKANLELIAGVMGGYHNEIEAAEKSGEYSRDGLAKLKVKRARKAMADLGQFRDKLAILDQRIVSESAAMKPKPKSSEDALVRYLREREVRDRLISKDILLRETLYVEGARDGASDLFLDACENAPVIPGEQPFLRPEKVAEGQRLRLLRANPEAAKQLDELKLTRNTLEQFINASEHELEAEVGPGVIKPDLVADAAKGKGTLNVI